MQRQRSGFQLFPEHIDLNQGSLPNNPNMDHAPSCNNRLNPVENRLPHYMGMTNDANTSSMTAANDSAPSYSNWDFGDSSDGETNILDESWNDDSKTRLGWKSSYDSSSVPSSSSEVYGLYLPHNMCKSGRHHETEQIPSSYASSRDLGSSSGFSDSSLENNNPWGLVFGTLDSPSKRKTVDGAPAPFYPGGSSSSNPLPGKSVMEHPSTSRHTRLGNLSTSSQQSSSSTRAGIMRPPLFPAPRVQEIEEHFASSRSNIGRDEPVSFDLSWSLGVNNVPDQLPRPVSTINPRSTATPRMDPNNTLNQANQVHANDTRRTHSSSSHWNGSPSSQDGVFADANNTRSFRRNNLEYTTNASVHGTRSFLPHHIDWSFAPETTSSSGNNSSGSHIDSISEVRASPFAWLPHQHYNQTSQSQNQRLSESSPWIPSSRNESEPGNSRSHYGRNSSVSSSHEAAASSSRAQPEQMPASLLMDMAGDDFNGWHGSSIVEGRYSLIGQVILDAVRRGVQLRPEDYMMFDEDMDEYAELHDRHRDMRLDVDNMSYEELLALEERIGNVCTGLSEGKIMACLKQHKHKSMKSSKNTEPCCICQEEYVTGQDIGILNCGHDFHTNCIKQWLTQKNLCPICKTTASKP